MSDFGYKIDAAIKHHLNYKIHDSICDIPSYNISFDCLYIGIVLHNHDLYRYQMRYYKRELPECRGISNMESYYNKPKPSLKSSMESEFYKYTIISEQD